MRGANLPQPKPVVTLQDVFGTYTATLDRGHRLCAPTNKNDEDPRRGRVRAARVVERVVDARHRRGEAQRFELGAEAFGRRAQCGSLVHDRWLAHRLDRG